MADQGILTASQVTLTSNQKAPREALGFPTAPRGVTIKRASRGIPGLLKGLVKALMLEIAYVETGNNLTFNQNNRYGRYGIHKNTLINYGYLNADGTSWEGVEGVSSADNLLASSGLQDRILQKFLSEQYTACVKVGAIKDNDNLATVAGMLAVAYQFQDFTYSSTNYDTSFLVRSGANLVVQLSNTLAYLGDANVVNSFYNESNIANVVNEFRQENFLTSTSTMSERRLYSIVEDLNTTSVNTTKVVKTALSSNIEGLSKQRAISSARANISILDNKIQSIYKNLPANRAKEWRTNGNIQDSLNRPGALFYNAGKYAISNLSASKAE